MTWTTDLFPYWGSATGLSGLALNSGLLFALFFEGPARSRWFAAVVAASMAVEISLFLALFVPSGHSIDELCVQPALFLYVAWPALLLLRSLWRLFNRPRALYEPPPDPPQLGGPYR